MRHKPTSESSTPENSQNNQRLEDSHWLAKRLGISYDMARQMGRKMQVPVIRIGKLLKYSPEAIDRWIENQTKGPAV